MTNLNEDIPSKKPMKRGISQIILSFYSHEANEEFKKSVLFYLDTLDEESRKTADREGLQQVSDKHVKRAAEFLFTYVPPQSPDKTKEFLIMGGYTLMGIWLTIVFELVFNQILLTLTSGVGSSVLLVLGIIMLFLGFNRK